MFLGAMFGFAICMKLLEDKINRNDGTVHSNQALTPFLGVMAAACIGAVAGALLFRFAFTIYAMVFHSPGKKG